MKTFTQILRNVVPIPMLFIMEINASINFRKLLFYQYSDLSLHSKNKGIISKSFFQWLEVFLEKKKKKTLQYCWEIYNISCQCSLTYIGPTKHKLCFCLHGHKLSIQNHVTNKSTLAKYC